MINEKITKYVFKKIFYITTTFSTQPLLTFYKIHNLARVIQLIKKK